MKRIVFNCLGRLILLLSVVLLPLPLSAAQPVIIADSSWTSNVVGLQPTDRLADEVSPQPLYLWLLIEGDATALRELEKQGMLPIRCRWIHYAGTKISQEGFGTLTDEIQLGVGTKEVLGKLRLEIENKPNHSFDWRTWSMKNRAWYGDWEVQVVYSDPARTPLQCRDGNSGELVPCRFEISIR